MQIFMLPLIILTISRVSDSVGHGEYVGAFSVGITCDIRYRATTLNGPKHLSNGPMDFEIQEVSHFRIAVPFIVFLTSN